MGILREIKGKMLPLRPRWIRVGGGFWSSRPARQAADLTIPRATL